MCLSSRILKQTENPILHVPDSYSPEGGTCQISAKQALDKMFKFALRNVSSSALKARMETKVLALIPSVSTLDGPEPK